MRRSYAANGFPDDCNKCLSGQMAAGWKNHYVMKLFQSPDIPVKNFAAGNHLSYQGDRS
jgi:hypothetical protein